MTYIAGVVIILATLEVEPSTAIGMGFVAAEGRRARIVQNREAMVAVVVGDIILESHAAGPIDPKAEHAMAVRFVSYGQAALAALECNPPHTIVQRGVVGYRNVVTADEQESIGIVPLSNIAG
ncbi:MAG: hypothetical protein PVG32_19890 [Anaerolineales bacterium]